MMDRSTVTEDVSRVLDETTFPRTVATVWERGRRASLEIRDAGTESIGDSERRAREIKRAIEKGKIVRSGAICVGGGGGACRLEIRQEGERRGIGVIAKNGESEVVDGDEGMRSRAVDLEGRVATAK